jgi:hypothetical protein
MMICTLGKYIPSGSEAIPESSPVVTDGACGGAAFTITQKANTNNKDLADIVILICTQEKFSRITFELTGRRDFTQPSPHQLG